MRAGERTGPHRTLETARALFQADLERLPESVKRIEEPDQVAPRISDTLAQLTARSRTDALRRAGVS
jgi:hypothetical protein